MIKLIKKLITKFRVWNDHRKFKKAAKKLGCVRYMDVSSMYPYMMKSAYFPLNKDFVYADTDSVKKKGE